jgi:FkbM family methyltransferase
VFQVGQFWFPDGEKHFTQFGDKISEYGAADRKAAYRYVKQWRCALDVGANVGVFSCDFATRFAQVIAFEPIPRTRKCLKRNVPENVQIEPVAVADKACVLKMYPTTTNSGGSFIYNHPSVRMHQFEADPNNLIKVPVRTIDSYNLPTVDLIKLDIQGAEFPAIVGARETIIRCRPVIMLEQKPSSPELAQYWKKTSKLLKSLGMTAKEKMRSDRIFVFDDK